MTVSADGKLWNRGETSERQHLCTPPLTAMNYESQVTETESTCCHRFHLITVQGDILKKSKALKESFSFSYWFFLNIFF